MKTIFNNEKFIIYRSNLGNFIGFIDVLNKKNYIFDFNKIKTDNLLYFYKYLNYDGCFREYKNILKPNNKPSLTPTSFLINNAGLGIKYDNNTILSIDSSELIIFEELETKIYEFPNFDNLKFLIRREGSRSFDIFVYDILILENLDRLMVFKKFRTESLFKKNVDVEYKKIKNQIQLLSESLYKLSSEKLYKLQFLSSMISNNNYMLNTMLLSFKNINFDYELNVNFKESVKNKLLNLLRIYYIKRIDTIRFPNLNVSLEKLYLNCNKQDVKFEVKINKINFKVYLNKFDFNTKNKKSSFYFHSLDLWKCDIDKFIKIFGNLPIYNEIIDWLETNILC